MSVSKPAILDYYEFDICKHGQYLKNTHKFEKFKLKCKYYEKQISAFVYVTSNWITYLKAKHSNEYI